ncbi:hypothetical protein K504DRAFT_442126 [Pleomassaria siparia CBS 279.74]|uniref:MYND-type domain-containing protein n=1 Tax=Pleomassaria siparia CBS 279.74 TaxID=1314801 RepID=A0A6G1JUC4_9PLEO|nr:hypothetical protein K504DRAFT_442126 [Pleomassaria siparia CBS 279.74]
MAVDMSSFLNPALCANIERIVDGKISPCQKHAGDICSSCSIVQYCSKECQRENWKAHKTTCKSTDLKETFQPAWVVKSYTPAFMLGPPLAPFGDAQYFWGNVPALDLLNVKDNEGEKDIVDKDLNLLFAASGDIRNVVKTVAGLPEAYKGQCTVVMNDMNFAIVARNAIILLVALKLEAHVAVPMIIHLWYSVLLPASMLEVLQDTILPLVDDVCTKIKGKVSGELQSKTFKFGGRSLRIVLTKGEWDDLRKFFVVPGDITTDKAREIRRKITMAESRVDYVDRALYGMPPGLRKSKRRFRDDGIVLPYGSSRKDFDTPNPLLTLSRTFFQQGSFWPMKDDADPLDGWFHREIIKHLPAAKNDMLGCLFFFLRDVLLDFCNRVQKCKMAFQLFAVNAVYLPRLFNKTSQGALLFDRIEVSNMCDRGYVGPQTVLMTFGPLLKPKSQSLKATLLMFFINAVREEEQLSGREADQASDSNRMRQLEKYIYSNPSEQMDKALHSGNPMTFLNASNPEIIRAAFLLDMFGDFDRFFRTFLEDTKMVAMAHSCGVKVKAANTIIEPFPFRVTDDTTQDEFRMICNDSTTGHERYLEIEKV